MWESSEGVSVGCRSLGDRTCPAGIRSAARRSSLKTRIRARVRAPEYVLPALAGDETDSLGPEPLCGGWAGSVGDIQIASSSTPKSEHQVVVILRIRAVSAVSVGFPSAGLHGPCAIPGCRVDADGPSIHSRAVLFASAWVVRAWVLAHALVIVRETRVVSKQTCTQVVNRLVF